MRKPWLFLLTLPLVAAIDGTVVNGTTGKPQAGAGVVLVNLSSGMQPVESGKSDSQGKFRFAQDVQGPVLIQATHQGVTYSKMVQPGSPLSGVELEVFSSSSRPGAAKLSQHMLLLEPSESQLLIREAYVYNNTGNTTWNNPSAGTLRFALPREADGKVQVMAAAPGGMPVQRPANPAGPPGVFKVDFPIKPGETRVDLTYQVPFQTPGKFATRFVQKSDSRMLAVANGVAVKGAGLVEKGKEPSTQATVFQVTGDSLAVELEGVAQPSAPAAAEESGDEGPGIQQIPARIHDKFYWILGLTVAILVLGMLLLYRANSQEGKAPERR